jgi:hypothetical protein
MESFSTLTEFAIAIAGFSGIVIALRARDGGVDPLVWFRNLCLLTWALGAAFGSLGPGLMASLGLSTEAIWAGSSFVLAILFLILMAVPLIARHRLDDADRARLARYVWVLALGGNGLAAGLLLANALGTLGPPSPGPVYAGIVWQLVFATLLFLRMLAQPPEPDTRRRS